MADITVDGTTRVWWVTSIANINSPTTTEINAGLSLETTMPPDGLKGFQPDTADVDNSSLASTFDTVTIGRDSYKNTVLTFKKQSGTDTIYATLVRGTAGYVVIRRYVAQTSAIATNDKVQVLPAICGQTQDMDPASNEVAKYAVPVKITSAPNLRATVA